MHRHSGPRKKLQSPKQSRDAWELPVVQALSDLATRGPVNQLNNQTPNSELNDLGHTINLCDGIVAGTYH